METASNRIVVVDGQKICYCLERKDVKNLNLRVLKNGSVFVSANEMVPCEEIDAFVYSRASYILKAVSSFREMAQYSPQPKRYVSGETFYILGRGLRLKVSQAEKDAVSCDGVSIFLEVRDVSDVEKKRRLMTRFLDQQCRKVFNDVMEELYPLFQKYGVEKPLLRIRAMDTRWGSCSTGRRVITLNKRLLEFPRNCIEYVVMHEMCHLIHPNHSKQFYTFLSVLMPDWKERKRFLDHSSVYRL